MMKMFFNFLSHANKNPRSTTYQWINEISSSHKDWASCITLWCLISGQMMLCDMSLERFHTKAVQIFHRTIEKGSHFITQLVTPYASDRLSNENLLCDLDVVQHIPDIQTQFNVLPVLGNVLHILWISKKENAHVDQIWELHKVPLLSSGGSFTM